MRGRHRHDAYDPPILVHSAGVVVGSLIRKINDVQMFHTTLSICYIHFYVVFCLNIHHVCNSVCIVLLLPLLNWRNLTILIICLGNCHKHYWLHGGSMYALL